MDNKNNGAQRMPSPFISFLPIVLLMGLLYFTISNFGSDSLSGGSQISLLLTSAFLRIPRYGILPHTVERLRTRHCQQYIRRIYSPNHTADYRSVKRNMDDKRSSTNTYILWHKDNPSRFLPSLIVHNMHIGIGHDRKLVDHHSHYRYRPDGYRKSTRI